MGADPRVTRIGAAIAVLLVVWVGVSGFASDGGDFGLLALVVVVFASFGAAYVVAGYHRALPPALVAAAALVVFAAGAPTLGRPFEGPFDYANAEGAFFVLATAAALMVAADLRPPAWRIAALAAAALFALDVVLTDSVGAQATLFLIPVGLLVRDVRPRRLLALLAGGGVLVAFASASAWGVLFPLEASGGLLGRADQALGTLRTSSWHGAVLLVRDHPLLGVGPGNFETSSIVSRGNEFINWAFNEFLELGAETGIPGMVLGLGLVGWALWALGNTKVRSRGVGVALMALGAVAIHANADYVLHFPQIAVATAALCGAAVRATPWRRDPTRPGRRPPASS
jgi:hypothetical protein